MGLSIRVLFLFCFTFLGFGALAQNQAYDELRDSSGRIRPQYAEFYRQWKKMSAQEREGYLKKSRIAFRGDNALDPLPRVFTAEEYDQILKPGVAQRARALMAFLKDHYSGTKSYLEHQIISEETIERILKRNLDIGFEGKVSPESISFLYGPDLIRDSSGQFRVIEDNPGYIGGIGDLELAFQEIRKLYPNQDLDSKYRNPEEFYEALARIYIHRAQKFGGRTILYMTAPFTDGEDFRIRKIFAKNGIETVTNRTRNRIKVTPNGVFLVDSTNPSSRKEKIGYMVMIGEHAWMDPSHFVSKQKLIAREIESHLESKDLSAESVLQLKELLARLQEDPMSVTVAQANRVLNKSNIQNDLSEGLSKFPEAKGLVNAMLKGQMGSNYSPGVDFIGDKEFYVYVEDLVRFYLNEEPILRNIPTDKFSSKATGRLRAGFFTKVFERLDQYVIKKVDGRGGDAVWVGPKVQKEEIEPLKERIRQNPDVFIAQAYSPLSQMNNLIVDTRVIADASVQGILVTETPWGRGLPKNGNGKVNLSDEGREVTILVEGRRAPYCKWLFK